MAITRQDYQYIRNTTPNSYQSKSSDGSLEVGISVNNLAPELNDKNVHNPNYVEFYGSKDPSKVWSCPLNGATNQVYEYKLLDMSKISSVTESSWLQISITGKTGTIAMSPGNGEGPNVGKKFFASFSETMPEGTVEVKPVDINTTVSYDPETRKATGCIYSVKANSTVYSFLEYKVEQTKHTATIETSFQKLGLQVAGAKVTDILGGDLVYGSESYEKTDSDISVKFTLKGSTLPLITRIYYEIESDFTVADTIKDGLLLTQLFLESGTSYVVQVIDAIAPNNEDLPDNHVKITVKDKVVDFAFDQYLFFRTPEDDPNTQEKEIYACEFEVFGAAFGYKLYHLDNDAGKLIQLRNFVSPVGAKIFIFKSDLPWMVNNKGVVVGLSNQKLNIPASTENVGQDASLSEQEIKEAFLPTPTLGVHEDKLRIYMPGTTEESDKWKYRDMWNATRNMANPPVIINNIKLFAYRDFLTDVPRPYNGQNIETRYGLIQTLQRNNKSTADAYSPVDINPEAGQTIRLKIYPISIEDNDSPYLELDFVEGTELTVNPSENHVFSLPLLSLFGYNYHYSQKAGFLDSPTIDACQYTSVCFAWGYEEGSGENKKRYRLSDFSEPVLIDRSLVDVEWQEDGTYLMTLKKGVLSRTTSPYYTDAIYLNKAEETLKIE